MWLSPEAYREWCAFIEKVNNLEASTEMKGWPLEQLTPAPQDSGDAFEEDNAVTGISERDTMMPRVSSIISKPISINYG